MRISFWKKLVFETLTVTVGEVAVLPAASRARAATVCMPLLTARVSQLST